MKIFCTCGRGTEVFVAIEIATAFRGCLNQIHITDGKIFCHLSERPENMHDIFTLKFCERIFVEVLRCTDVKVLNAKQGGSFIKSCINATHLWTEALEILPFLKQKETKSLDSEEIITKRSCSKVLTFRVSAKCSGRPAKYLDQKWLSCTIGHKVSEVTSMKVDLKNPDIEIFCHLNNDGFVVGIPCCSQPLSKRSYVKHHGLRNTIASILAFLCGAKPGMTVLDPTCGRGILLMEMALMCESITVVGCDISSSMMAEAESNISHFNSERSGTIQLLQCDARFIPLQSSSVDIVLCDIPFGIKHILLDMEMFLKSIDKLLVKDGKCVILCGLETAKQLLSEAKRMFPCSENLDRCAKSSEESPLSKLVHQICACNDAENFDTHEMLEAITSSIDLTSYTNSFLQGNLSGDDLPDLQVEHHCLNNCKGQTKEGHVTDERVDLDVCIKSAWRREFVHYLKLGETDSFVCVFKKIA